MASLNNAGFINFIDEPSVLGRAYPNFGQTKKYNSVNLDFTPCFNRDFGGSYGRKKYNFYIPEGITITTENIFNKVVSLAPPVIKLEEPVMKIFDNQLLPMNEESVLSPLVLSGTEVIADFSGHIRKTFDTSNKVYGTENPVALAALGFTTGFNIISGGFNVQSGINDLHQAKKISDVAGTALGHLKIGQGATSAAGGAVYVPVRALSLATLWSSAKIVSTTAGILGSLGDGLFGISLVCAGIATGIKFHEIRLFQKGLYAILNDSKITEQARSIKALDYLKQLVTISPDEKTQILNQLKSDPQFLTLPEETKVAKVAEKESLLLQRKEACFKRVLSEDCLNLIQQKGVDEATTVIDAVKKESRTKFILSLLSIVFISIGAALAIATFIFTGPIWIIVSTAAALIVSFAMLIIDGCGLINEFKNSVPGRFDKLCILFSSLMALVCVALVFFLTGGLAPLIAAIAVGVVWMGINIACYYRLSHLPVKS